MNQANKLKRKKKNHGPGNPSKRHRDRLNAELDNLARLLPFPEETVTKLDKISILRLTVSYLRAKSFFQVNGKNGQEETCEDLVREFEGNGLFSQLSLEALDGFIVVITQDGQLFYVSENVRDFLGYSQAAVIHQSIYKFLHIDDQDMVKLKLAWPSNVPKETAKNDGENRRRDSVSVKQENGKVPDTSDVEKLNRSFTCRMKCTLNHGGGFYKLFKLSGRLREIQTRKRDGDVVEYGLFAICSPAHNQNANTSASSVKKEVAITAQKRLERTASDPLGSRRNVYPPHPMMRQSHMGPFLYPDARAPFSPLASPTASSDSEHPSPVSSQTGKTGSMDQENHSDISELSNSSKSSMESEMRERMMAANKARMANYRFHERKMKGNFADGSPDGEEDSPARKRSRSLADASELRKSEYEAMRNGLPFGIGAGTTLPPIAEFKGEVKTEGGGNPGAGSETSRAKTELMTRRPLNTYDSRLDAARGLVNLAGMPIPFPGLYPFPELMYPNVMFPRLDQMHTPLDAASHMRNPFDPHNPCCPSNDPCSQMAMRRWLSTSDLYRSQMNPMLAAQASLMSPVERMRYFQFPFPYGGYPYPGPMPFDMAAGLNERNLPEFAAMKRREGENSEPQTPTGKEAPSESANSDIVVDPSSPRSDTPREGVVVKKEKTEGHVNSTSEKPTSPRKETESEERITNGLGESEAYPTSGEGETQEKTVSQFRVSLTGIQAEFASRLENLNKSFAQSFAGDVEKKDK